MCCLLMRGIRLRLMFAKQKLSRCGIFFETNFVGTFLSVKYGVEAFEKSGGIKGRHVVICSSSLSHFSVPKFGIYSATKSAQLSLAQSLRVELKKAGGFVSTVHPVGTESELIVSDAVGNKRKITNSNTP